MENTKQQYAARIDQYDSNRRQELMASRAIPGIQNATGIPSRVVKELDELEQKKFPLGYN